MRWLLIGIGCAALAGCSKASDRQQPHADRLEAYDVAPAPPAAIQPPGIVALQAVQPPAGDTAAPGPIAVTLPQIAYSYRYDFRLPEAAIARVQAAHVTLCDRLGPARCQLVGSQLGGGDDNAATASLKLRVAASLARRFGAALEQSVAQGGGRTVTSAISADDVSKAIIDTDARLRQRTLLVERLTAILRTHNGKVAELVEAERSVAAAQEEIDQARGELADLRGRVAMSSVEIAYAAIAPAASPARSGVGDAASQSWSAFVLGLSALATLVIFLLPWTVLIGAVALGVRAILRRHRRPPPD